MSRAPPRARPGVMDLPKSQTPQRTVRTGEALFTVATWLASRPAKCRFWKANPSTVTTRVR